LLLITLSTQAQQKKGFLDRINESLQKVNTPPETGKIPSSSGGSGRSVFSAGKTIQGEWKEYGSGGRINDNNSPRNHIYTLDLDRDVTEATFTDNSVGQVHASMYSSNGKRVWAWGYGKNTNGP
jgi:hypothetical protein